MTPLLDVAVAIWAVVGVLAALTLLGGLWQDFLMGRWSR